VGAGAVPSKFADLAFRLGWHDQAHFINDFRSTLGRTPGEYAARHGG
jgi:AraC-like DNA-binding protein